MVALSTLIKGAPLAFELFGGLFGDKDDLTPAQRQETGFSAEPQQGDEEYRSAFFREFPGFLVDADGDGKVDQSSLDSLPREVRRDPTFRRLFGTGQLTPFAGGAGGGGGGGAGGGFIPGPTFSPSGLGGRAGGLFDAAQGDLGAIRDRIQAIREGRITPESEGTVLSEAGIQALLNKRKAELESTLAQGEEALFGQLSQRGLLGSGVSGPAIRDIFDERQKKFTDPFTQFGNTIRAQVEQQRATRNAQLQQEATALRQFSTGQSAGLGKFFADLGFRETQFQKQLESANAAAARAAAARGGGGGGRALRPRGLGSLIQRIPESDGGGDLFERIGGFFDDTTDFDPKINLGGIFGKVKDFFGRGDRGSGSGFVANPDGSDFMTDFIKREVFGGTPFNLPAAPQTSTLIDLGLNLGGKFAVDPTRPRSTFSRLNRPTTTAVDPFSIQGSVVSPFNFAK